MSQERRPKTAESKKQFPGTICGSALENHSEKGKSNGAQKPLRPNSSILPAV
jgi:hypothetical protein